MPIVIKKRAKTDYLKNQYCYKGKAVADLKKIKQQQYHNIYEILYSSHRKMP
jgi:hypothetical protein